MANKTRKKKNKKNTLSYKIHNLTVDTKLPKARNPYKSKKSEIEQMNRKELTKYITKYGKTANTRLATLEKEHVGLLSNAYAEAVANTGRKRGHVRFQRKFFTSWTDDEIREQALAINSFLMKPTTMSQRAQILLANLKDFQKTMNTDLTLTFKQLEEWTKFSREHAVGDLKLIKYNEDLFDNFVEATSQGVSLEEYEKMWEDYRKKMFQGLELDAIDGKEWDIDLLHEMTDDLLESKGKKRSKTKRQLDIESMSTEELIYL